MSISHETFMREVDIHIAKLLDAYRMLLKKSQIDMNEEDLYAQAQSLELFCKTATTNIVSILFFRVG